MPKKFIFIITIIIVAVVIGIGYWVYQSTKPTETGEAVLDPKNCSYNIEGKNITLKDGYSEDEIIAGSAPKVITRYFGNETSGDVNGDGLPDVAFVVKQDLGGSGVFYYVVAGLGDAEGCKGTSAILLGDRIVPQAIKIENSEIVVNYADRKTDEAMVVAPSIVITKQVALEGMTLMDITSDEAKKEQACVISGGTVETSLCCTSASDFPNLCLIGACGCGPSSSKEIKICDCGEGKCFDGQKCAVR